jgi:hypothetical protein
MRKMFPVELNPVVLARSSLCDLDRYLVLMLSGGFTKKYVSMLTT